MKNLYTSLATILFLTCAFGLTAQPDVVDVKDAAKMLNSDDVIIISARTPADFQKVHIPGAINIDHKDLYGAQSMLLPTSKLATLLGEKGIDNNKKLLIYDDGSSKYAGRLYWVFSYLGVTDVKIIDGGMKAWRMGRKPVTKNPSNVVVVNFTAKPNASLLATMAQVKAAINSTNSVIIDARTAEEFNGVAATSLRAGRIPSSINLDFKEVLNEKGLLKSTEDLAAIFTSIGVEKNKSVIVYCESSVRAGVVFLALKGIGYPNVSVYDGAYLEWQSLTSNSVAMN